MTRRGGMTCFLAVILVWMMAVPAYAAGESGTIRVNLGPKLAGKTVTVYAVVSIGPGEAELGEELGSEVLSEDGVAMFTGLAEGMYLLTVENILAVMVSLPEQDGSWMAQIAPGEGYLPPETGQPVTPVLWAMGMIVSAFGIGIWYESWHKRKRK